MSSDGSCCQDIGVKVVDELRWSLQRIEPPRWGVVYMCVCVCGAWCVRAECGRFDDARVADEAIDSFLLIAVYSSHCLRLGGRVLKVQCIPMSD